MRFLLFSSLILIPSFVFAQGIVPCDGALGNVCNACQLMSLGQKILSFIIQLVVIGGVIMIAIAGLKMVTSAGNASKVEEAKGMMSNVLIGIMITLAAWLIIDTVMKLPNFVDEKKFGTWHQIQCVAEPVYNSSTPNSSSGVVVAPGGTSSAGNGACAAPRAQCEPAKLQGYSSGLFSSNAQLLNAMSVMCQKESSGNTTVEATTDRTWKSNEGFSYGLFQINLTQHTFNDPKCSPTPLNCPSAFERAPEYADCTGRSTDPAKCFRTESWGTAKATNGFGMVVKYRALYDKCVAAAQNPACNIPKAEQIFLTEGRSGWVTSANKCGLNI